MKKSLTAISIAALAILIAFTGCANKTNKSAEAKAESTEISKVERVEAVSRPTFKSFNDSVGRTVEVTGTFNKVIAGTPEAQLYIYAVAPEKLVGLSEKWPEGSEKFIKEEVLNLPVYGAYNFYADSLDQQAIKESGADLVLIVGEPGDMKEGIQNQLDMMQEYAKIPFIYVEDSFQTTANTLTKIGKLLSTEKEAESAAAYANEVLTPVNQSRQMFTVYYSGSSDGLTPVLPGTEDFEVFEYMGIANAVPEDFTGSYNFDGLKALNPEMIFLADKRAYEFATTNEDWKTIPAVQSGNIFFVPDAPYNLLSSPNSVQRLLGLQWLRLVTYGSLTPSEFMDTAASFYEDVMHVSLDNAVISSELNI